MVDLTISLVTADNEKLILDCLRSIYENTQGLKLETYVVINASSDDSEESIKKEFPQAKLIINDKKLGFTHNHNMVMRKGRGKYFLVLNDDTVIINGALRKMVDYMDVSGKVGVLGCKIMKADKSLERSCGTAITHKYEFFKTGVLQAFFPFLPKKHFSTTTEVTWVTGACLMVRAQATQEVGLFDENIVIYFEDGDLCYRMNKAGWKVVFYPEAEIIHYHGQTRKKHLARDLFIIYQSRLYFFTKHYYGLTLLIVRLFTIMEVSLRYVKISLPFFHSSEYRTQAKSIRETYKRVIWMALIPSSTSFKGGSQQ